jgi:uncharacterized protein YjiS (DUF1127 family)
VIIITGQTACRSCKCNYQSHLCIRDFKRKFEKMRDATTALSPANSKDTAMLSSIIIRYRAWKRREAMRRELLHLTDRELQDIGISRSDIDRVISQGLEKEYG